MWLLCVCTQIRGANILGLPIITTEQYPKALGSTVTELTDVLPAGSAPIIAKTRFSMITPEVQELLKQKSAVSQVRVSAGVSRVRNCCSRRHQAAVWPKGEQATGFTHTGCISSVYTRHWAKLPGASPPPTVMLRT